jgi:hypothetical protein
VGQFNPETARDVVAQLPHPSKVIAQHVGWRARRRDRHETLQRQGGMADQRPGQVLDPVGRHTPLPRRPGQVDLDEHREPPPGVSRGVRQSERQAARVHRVDPVEGFQRASHLVAL